MASITVVDNKRHRDIRVFCEPKLSPQDGLGYVQVFPSELDAAHKEYPIFLKKNSVTGRFFLAALLSSDLHKNDFLIEGKWYSRYVPLVVRRGPFIIGRSGEVLNLCLDLDDDRVSSDGERLFDQNGEPTAMANKAISVLSLIHRGYQQSEELIEALTAESLIEPITIKPTHGVGGANLKGLYSINPQRLRELHGETLERLNSSSFLQSAYLLASSSSNVGFFFNKNNIFEKMWISTGNEGL
ncbi:SapC family protein [Microbulbifer epialgicus]|uniref:SapC family protein n=1 Tax=Microbulbifer epialgicus TaxID=393907 RepID=A0ABV4P5Q5_9GAMM